MLAVCTHRHRPLTAWIVMIILRFSPPRRMVPAGRSRHHTTRSLTLRAEMAGAPAVVCQLRRYRRRQQPAVTEFTSACSCGGRGAFQPLQQRCSAVHEESQARTAWIVRGQGRRRSGCVRRSGQNIGTINAVRPALSHAREMRQIAVWAGQCSQSVAGTPNLDGSYEAYMTARGPHRDVQISGSSASQCVGTDGPAAARIGQEASRRTASGPCGSRRRRAWPERVVRAAGPLPW